MRDMLNSGNECEILKNKYFSNTHTQQVFFVSIQESKRLEADKGLDAEQSIFHVKNILVYVITSEQKDL